VIKATLFSKEMFMIGSSPGSTRLKEHAPNARSAVDGL
jgi:hypothetical protein